MQDKEKELNRNIPGPWLILVTQLTQLIATEKSYIDLGFLANKNKSFLRKDVSINIILYNFFIKSRN